MTEPRTPTGLWLPNPGPHSPEWHAQRACGVGSSDVACLLGLTAGDWDSPTSLYHRKRGDLPPTEPSETMRHGTRLEAYVADLWAEAHPGVRVVPGGSWAHRDRLWQRANPDRLVLDGDTVVAPVECKLGSTFEETWGPAGSDEIPVKYRAQLMWQMDTLGLTHGHVAVLLDGRAFRSYVVDYDPDDARLLRDTAAEFWQRVQDGRPPPLDGLSATTRAIKALHPDIDDVEVEVPATLARAYAAACAAEKRARERKRLAENKLRARIGRGRYAVHHGQRVATRVVYDQPPYTHPGGRQDQLRPARTKETP